MKNHEIELTGGSGSPEPRSQARERARLRSTSATKRAGGASLPSRLCALNEAEFTWLVRAAAHMHRYPSGQTAAYR